MKLTTRLIKQQIPLWLSNISLVWIWGKVEIENYFGSESNFNNEIKNEKNWKRINKQKVSPDEIGNTVEDCEFGENFKNFSRYKSVIIREFTSRLDFCGDTLLLTVASSLDDTEVLFWSLNID